MAVETLKTYTVEERDAIVSFAKSVSLVHFLYRRVDDLANGINFRIRDQNNEYYYFSLTTYQDLMVNTGLQFDKLYDSGFKQELKEMIENPSPIEIT